jgi:hypothetical protein
MEAMYFFSVLQNQRETDRQNLTFFIFKVNFLCQKEAESVQNYFRLRINEK